VIKPSTEYEVTSQKRRNIFLVVKEALHNIIKHSQAKNVFLSIKELHGQMLIEIKDDGIGFDVTQIEKGNGLNSMQKRMESIGGFLAIESEKGTILHIAIKLSSN
jgi:two-component system sensor histidine kinase DesK